MPGGRVPQKRPPLPHRPNAWHRGRLSLAHNKKALPIFSCGKAYEDMLKKGSAREPF
jgi:hypothetical protein